MSRRGQDTSRVGLWMLDFRKVTLAEIWRMKPSEGAVRHRALTSLGVERARRDPDKTIPDALR